MTNQVHHILIAHKSHIVFHGLTSIFQMGKISFHAEHVTSLQQLEIQLQKNEASWVFISPQLILNCEDKFHILRLLPGFRWVGIVHASYSRETYGWFDNLIYIDDSETTICDLFKASEEKEQDHPTDNIDRSLLSERELDVLRLVVQGFSNKEIADRLFISTHTVISHRKNITQKTGIKTVSGLTIFAVVNKLVELDNYF